MPSMPNEILNSLYLPWPTDWTAVFGRQAPLVVEIGFGNGEFLLHTARQHPDWNLLGVEISLPSLRKAAKKAAAANLTNIRVVQGDARLLLWAQCQPNALHGLTINFPDPWPKSGHTHRRLINADFLTLAATRLPPGAFLDIATDHPDYQEWVLAHLQQTPYFDSRQATAYTLTDPNRIVTKYEQKAADEGRISHYYKWQRNDQPAPDTFAIPQEVDMPHVIFESPMTLAEMAAQFTPQQETADSVIVRLMDIFIAPRNPVLLADVYVNEQPLSQRVALMVRRREKGDYVLSVHEMGFPRKTAGVATAVQVFGNWLLQLHPDTHVTGGTVAVDDAVLDEFGAYRQE